MSTHRYLKGDMIHFNHKNLNLRWQSNGHWLSVWFVAWKSSKCLLAVGVFCWTFQRRSVKFGTPAPSLSCLMRQEWLFCPFFIIMYPWARQDTLLVDYYFGWFLCCWGEERGSHIKMLLSAAEQEKREVETRHRSVKLVEQCIMIAKRTCETPWNAWSNAMLSGDVTE